MANTEREQLLEEVALKFAGHLRDDTGIEVSLPEELPAIGLSDAFSRLNEAVGKLTDLASVYGPDSMPDSEPLVLPVAVLAGEYLRVGAGAIWLEPEAEPDRTVWILMPGQAATDLTAAVRINLLAGEPDLTAIMCRLLGGEARERG